MKKRISFWSIRPRWLLASTLISSALLGACKKPPVEVKLYEKVNDTTIRLSSEVLANIKKTQVVSIEFPEQLTLMGKISIVEDRTEVVPARVTGRIESVNLASGEYAKKGQLLARIFSTDFSAAREEYLQALKGSKTRSPASISNDLKELTQMSKKRLEVLGLAPQDIESLASDQSDFSKLLPIRAPRDGFLVSKNATVGNLVNLGDPLFTSADLKKVWFSGDIYPEDIKRVKKDQEVVIKPDEADLPIYGRISFISPVVDPSTRTIKIRALMDNSRNLLKPEMYVQGNLILRRRQAILIPAQAMIRSSDQISVFKKVGSNSLEKGSDSLSVQLTPVQIGTEQNGMTEIKSGIQPGDEIVSEGALLLFAALNSSHP